MSSRERFLLDRLGLNGWPLLSLVAASMTAVVLADTLTVNLGSAGGVSAMIQLSVRLAVPFLYLAFAASALAQLVPGSFGRWLIRNRRMIGLCFAAAMAWQLFFILWLVLGHWDYYLEEAYSTYDLAEQVPGYLVLTAMTITSFAPSRRRLSPGQWRALHTGGIYFLWAVVWSTYWFELYYYDDIAPIDYVYYWTGFLAWMLRVMAWVRRRRRPAAAPRAA
jgi:DMSO/TMAO reductase YedYZ heme-binding membrane subunit